ncbi:DUF1642 domain-containing protein [Lactococcus lactis]|uniref:DUF1642 domain-containing protein n=1 Tax=Lactococcus lactis TaxID=1358 RepID=UPI00288E0769|nr:DUF1642 domain-containing protein [Lactococcus lactis]MDT2967960.1 DUF1642 domain-containing protein [Lactococcus lactis]
MTKFEEELMATAKMIPTSDGNEIKFKISSALYDYLLVSNGEAELYLQQQALPVVPECVAEYIERCKRSDCGLIWAIRPDRDANDNSEKVYDWLFPNGVDYLARPDKENQIKFVRAWLNGYTVEKPQLFYLKHIDMSKRNSINDLYLKKYIHADLTENGEHRLSHAMSAKGIYPSKEYCAFTQQEIDSMQTGSYKKIPVPVEDGE